MKRALTTLSVIAMAALAATPDARASACANDRYLHNGSIMDVQVCDGGQLVISYAQPRGQAQALASTARRLGGHAKSCR